MDERLDVAARARLDVLAAPVQIEHRRTLARLPVRDREERRHRDARVALQHELLDAVAGTPNLAELPRLAPARGGLEGRGPGRAASDLRGSRGHVLGARER